MILNSTQEAIGIKLGHFLPLLIPGALRIIAAVFILIAGIWLSEKGEYFAARLLSRLQRIDRMLQDFFANIVRYLILTVTVVTVLSQFGVQTTSLVAIIGAASLAIGLALQGTLSNLAAGVMLLIFRPFRLGQQVQVGGNTGLVKELTLFWTEIVTTENTQIIIPNSQVWGQALKNFSTYASPPGIIEVRFPVTDSTLSRSRKRIQDIISEMENIAKTPVPTVLADRAPTDNTLQLVVKFAPANADSDSVKGELIENVVTALQNSESGHHEFAPS